MSESGGRRGGHGIGAASPDFAANYPNIAKWVRGRGWIEIGENLPPLDRPSCVRALDEGGLIWAGEASYPTLDDALRDLDAAIGRQLREERGEGPATASVPSQNSLPIVRGHLVSG